jgi:MSHA pilin protein MshC
MTGDQRGFTMMEIVMVLVLIGILAAVSAPRFFSKTDFDQYGFYNEVLSSVRYAQKLAVATCSPVRIDLTATGYTIYRAGAAPASCGAVACADPGAIAANRVTDPSNPSQVYTRTAPSGTTISAANTIVFCPLGNTLNETSYSFSISGPVTRTISIAGVTGFVR